MVRSARSLLALLVVPAAVLAGHGLGYELAGSGHAASHPVDHGYLPTAAAVALPAAVAALLWVAAGLGGHRDGAPARAPSVVFLVAAQWVLFASLELIEHAAAGEVAAVVASPALWLGLLSQVAVAAATALLLRAASSVGAHAVTVRCAAGRRLAPSPGWLPAPVARPKAPLVVAAVSSRGPPRRHR